MFSGNHSPEVNVAFIMALTVVSTDTNSACSTCTTNKNQLTRRKKNPVMYKYLCFHEPCRIQLSVHFKALIICSTYMNTWTVLGNITKKDQWCYNYNTVITLLHSTKLLHSTSLLQHYYCYCNSSSSHLVDTGPKHRTPLSSLPALWALKDVEIIGNIVTDSVTYYHFQIMHLVCFYIVDNWSKWLPIIAVHWWPIKNAIKE